MKKRKRQMKSQLGIFRNAKIFALLAVLVIVLAIPITLSLLNQNTYQPSLAAATTTLTLSPATATGNVGSPLSFDLSLNPGGSNLVSTITLYITYDGSVLQPTASGFMPGDGSAAFSPCSSPSGLLCVFDGPTYNTCTGNQCSMYITLSVGNDFTKAIKTTTTIAKLNFTAQANGVSMVDFDPKTQILSIASTDSPGENVLQSKTPATVNIGNVAVTITPPAPQTPVPTTPVNPSPTSPVPTSPNSTPSPTNPVPTVNPTNIPVPTVPIPTGIASCNVKDIEGIENIINQTDKQLDQLKKSADHCEAQLNRTREKSQQEQQLDNSVKMENAREQNEKLREQKINHDFQMSNAGGNHHGGCLGGYDPNNPNGNPNCIDNGSGGIIPANQSPNGTPQSFWSWVLSFLGIR